jgi:hypothetical protein
MIGPKAVAGDIFKNRASIPLAPCIFFVKWLKLFSVPVQKVNNLLFREIYGYKKRQDNLLFFPFPFLLFGSGINAGYGMENNIPDRNTVKEY